MAITGREGLKKSRETEVCLRWELSSSLYEIELRSKDGHKQISVFLEADHPGQRGFSVRSVERFCSNRGIHKTPRINDQKLDEAVGCI